MQFDRDLLIRIALDLSKSFLQDLPRSNLNILSMNKTIIILIGCILFNSCSKSTYRITEPAPTLEIKALQDTYTLQEPAYIQLKVSQQGYDGEFQVSAVLSEREPGPTIFHRMSGDRIHSFPGSVDDDRYQNRMGRSHTRKI